MAILRSDFGLSAAATTAEKPIFAIFVFENLGRSLIAAAISLQGLAILGGEAKHLSQAYLGAAFLAILMLVISPLVCRFLTRKQLFLVSVGAAAVSNIMFIIPVAGCFFVALAFRSIAAGLLLAAITMYFLERVPKHRLANVEASKAVLVAVTWLTGPVIGIWLWNNVSNELPFLIAFIMSGLSGLIFLCSGLSSQKLQPPCQDLRMLVRSYVDFFSSFQMVASYLIEIGKAMFWVALFYYLPLYVLEAELPLFISGFMLSASVLGLFGAPYIARLVDKLSVETVLIVAFFWSGITLSPLLFMTSESAVGLFLIFFAGLGVNILDYAGHLPFLRRVPQEREGEFTVVFSTWRDTATLLTPLLAIAVLPIGSLNLLFGLIGVSLLASCMLVLCLPKITSSIEMEKSK